MPSFWKISSKLTRRTTKPRGCPLRSSIIHWSMTSDQDTFYGTISTSSQGWSNEERYWMKATSLDSLWLRPWMGSLKTIQSNWQVKSVWMRLQRQDTLNLLTHASMSSWREKFQRSASYGCLDLATQASLPSSGWWKRSSPRSSSTSNKATALWTPNKKTWTGLCSSILHMSLMWNVPLQKLIFQIWRSFSKEEVPRYRLISSYLMVGRWRIAYSWSQAMNYPCALI